MLKRFLFVAFFLNFSVACVAESEILDGADMGMTQQGNICGADDRVFVNSYEGTLASGVPGPDVSTVRRIQPWSVLVQSGVGSCTGTLVSEDLVLTNQHCVDGVVASSMSVLSNYEFESNGTGLRPDIAWYSVSEIVESDAGLDYALLRVDGRPGSINGWARMRSVDAFSDTSVILVGHPSGLQKMVSAGLANSNPWQWWNIYHDADTLGGSSGSGVFDGDARIVALHHSSPPGDFCGGAIWNIGTKIQDVINSSVVMQGIAARSLARIGVLFDSGEVQVKDGPLNASWHAVTGNVSQLLVAGHRIAVLKDDGTAWVKQGSPSEFWIQMGSNLQQIALSSDRFAAVASNGDVLVNEGSLTGTLKHISGDARQVSLAGTRIGVVHDDGRVNVKEGALNAAWSLVGSGVQHVSMTSNRIGLLKTNGDVLVNSGAPTAPFSTISWGANQLVLSGSRVGVRQPSGLVFVKEGALNSAWVQQTGTAKWLSMSGSRIGVVHFDGRVTVKEGGLSAGWTTQTWNARTVILTEEL